MTLPLASGPSVTRVFVDPSLSSVEILIRIAHQIGFATIDSAADADLCIAAAPVDDRLSCCPGSGFGVNGRVATFDAELIATLDRYQRVPGKVEYSGKSFTVHADGVGKSGIMHWCAKTLIQLLLSNGKDVYFLWWFPDAAPGVANYRVDVDDNTKRSFDLIAKTIDCHASWCSVFFTTSCFASDFSIIRGSYEAGAEVGSHGHYHYTFERDPATNEKNLRTSIDFLRQRGLDIRGAVMPSGKSFAGIGEVMSENDIAYTSNFGLIFDSLPIEISQGKSEHLEIPIHPVAPGNVIKASSSLADIDQYLNSYYMETARKLSDSFLPLFFYGHNNDTQRLSLLPGLLDRLAAAFPEHVFLRLDHYAAFWKERLDLLTRWRPPCGSQSLAVIRHDRPDRIAVLTPTGERSWPLALETLFLSPLAFVGEGAQKPRLRDRLADRYELETILPISALSLMSYQGWKSVGYKIARRVMSALLRRRHPEPPHRPF